MNTANERMKYLRKDLLGMSMEKFGDALGITKSGVSEIEAGRRNVTDQHLRLLETQDIKGKRVNIKWLRTGEGEPFKPVPLNEEIRQYFAPLDNLSDEFKTAFADALAELQPEDWERILDMVKDLRRKALERKAAREREEGGTLLQAAHQRTDIDIPGDVDTSDDEFFD